jgi:hypothetical protein
MQTLEYQSNTKNLKNYGILGKGSLSQRIILQKEIGRVALNVVFVVQ